LSNVTEWSPTAVHSCRVTAAPNSEPCEGVPCKGPYPHTPVGDLYIVLIVPGVWALPQCAFHAIHAILELYRRLCACSLTEWQCSVEPLYSGAVALQGLWPRHKEASYYVISTWHTWWPSQSSPRHLQESASNRPHDHPFASNHPLVSPHPLLQTIVMQHCCGMCLQSKDILFQTNSLSLSLSTRREFMS